MEKILVTGATGYIGGRLVPRLLQKGYKVRAISRSIEKLKGRTWSEHANVELVAADLLDFQSLKDSVEGCTVAYYFVHSMAPDSKDFVEVDRKAAQNFVKATQDSDIKRIIYLGGLGGSEKSLSRHLQSRHEVSEILQSSSIPVTVFRSAMVIGSGSASFEILRYLVDRLPLMITPKWVKTPSQPIFISNVLYYLIQCLNTPETIGQSFDIGGPDIISYEDMMKMYAEIAFLPRRLIIRVPVLTPWLSSQWIGLVSPIPPALAKPLVEGLKNPVICQENRIQSLIPQRLVSCHEAIERAVENSIQNKIETSWSDAGNISPAEWINQKDPKWAGGTYFAYQKSIVINSNKEEVWNVLMRIGGKTGWYSHQWLWTVRGFIDRIIGGVGLRRGRRSSSDLYPGDAVDFWRVNIIDRAHRLVLVAEMKVPGKAILEFLLEEKEPNKCCLQLIAHFLPNGLWGILYWRLVSPFHSLIFNGMLNEIAKQQFLSRRVPYKGKAHLSFKSFSYSSIDATADIVEISIDGCRLNLSRLKEEIPNQLYIYFANTSFSAKAYIEQRKKINEDDYQEIILRFLEMDPTSKQWLCDLIK